MTKRSPTRCAVADPECRNKACGKPPFEGLCAKHKKQAQTKAVPRGLPVLAAEIEILLLKNRVAKLESFCGMFFAMWSAGRSAEYAAMTAELGQPGSTKLPTIAELAKTTAATEKLEREG